MQLDIITPFDSAQGNTFELRSGFGSQENHVNKGSDNLRRSVVLLLSTGQETCASEKDDNKGKGLGTSASTHFRQLEKSEPAKN